jgi:hypothetical protein
MDTASRSTARIHHTSVSPLHIAHKRIEDEILALPPGEIEARIISFSLREIERSRARVNRVPELSPKQARTLYLRLIRNFVQVEARAALGDCLAGRAA